MTRFLATVIANNAVTLSTHLLTLHVGPLARQVRPGQFVHIRCGTSNDPLLRRPMSVCRVDGEEMDLAVWRAGPGSNWIADREPTDTVDCLGPQGRGFHVDRGARHLLLVGGGFGTSPLIGLAEHALARGRSVTLAVEAHTAAELLPSRLLPPQVEYVVATSDGSAGQQGSAITILGPWMRWADSIYGSGPASMMAALASQLRDELPRKRVEVALTAPMACGLGACLTCVVETTKGQRRACIDGPVFDMSQIVWGQ